VLALAAFPGESYNPKTYSVSEKALKKRAHNVKGKRTVSNLTMSLNILLVLPTMCVLAFVYYGICTGSIIGDRVCIFILYYNLKM
jgi:hypothetical protein